MIIFCSRYIKHVFLGLLLLALVPSAAIAQDEDGYKHVKGVVHLNSNVSSGEYSPEMLVEIAENKGVDTVFVTENLMPRWEYGLFPFRGVFKKIEKRKGLLEYGTEKYDRRIDAIDQKNPEVTVYISAEVAPFYYWSGNPFDKEGLTLNNWDLQFLVMGMDAEDYDNIPTVSNGGFAEYGPGSLLKLWPLLLVLLGGISLKKKHPRFYLADSLCWGIIIIGIGLLLYYFPFQDVKYDQYHGSRGTGPYQEVIDYVNSKGGMTFWSNPEAETDVDLGQVSIKSPTANEYMLKTDGYTGFCCFYEGYRSVGGPGGVWDTVLNEYCSEKRKMPIWAIGELSYHSKEASGGKEINEVQTVFLVPKNTRKNILGAMRTGNMYALRRTEEYELQLDSFTVKYENKVQVSMGGTLEAQGPVTVSFGISWEGETEDKVVVALIRSGKVIKEFAIESPGEIVYEDDFYEPGKKVYYRLDIRGEYPSMLFSNPIFVDFVK
jgi:hypothetical protein